MHSLWISDILNQDDLRAMLRGEGLPAPRELAGCRVLFAYRVRDGESRDEVVETRALVVKMLEELGASVRDHEAPVSDEGELAALLDEAVDNVREAREAVVLETWRAALAHYLVAAAWFIGERGGVGAEPFVVLRGAVRRAREGGAVISDAALVRLLAG